eukprot:11680540-Karenia_brevis.AAC.1
MDVASKLEGGVLVAANPHMNLGEEHVGMRRRVCDHTRVLPEISQSEERWTKFLKALVYIMPEGTITDMW